MMAQLPSPVAAYKDDAAAKRATKRAKLSHAKEAAAGAEAATADDGSGAGAAAEAAASAMALDAPAE
jgi:hypothetical protein